MSEPACTKIDCLPLAGSSVPRLFIGQNVTFDILTIYDDVSLDMILITLVILSGCSRDRRHLKPLLYAKIPIKV